MTAVGWRRTIPKKGANFGVYSLSAILVCSEGPREREGLGSLARMDLEMLNGSEEWTKLSSAETLRLSRVDDALPDWSSGPT